MNITLTLSSEKQAELQRRAAAAGTDLASYILDTVQETLDERNGSSVEQAPYEEWSGDFRAWIAGHRSRNPQFDDRRESIYD